jgi:hypothetical protein
METRVIELEASYCRFCAGFDAWLEHKAEQGERDLAEAADEDRQREAR